MFIENGLTDWLLRQTTSNGIRRVSFAGGAIASDIGNVRNENQDRAVIVRGIDNSLKPFSVVAIADGIGGMKYGAECASIAIGSFVLNLTMETIGALGTPLSWVKAATEYANKAVYSKFDGNGGTTFCAVFFTHNSLSVWVSAGDSQYCSATQPSPTGI